MSSYDAPHLFKESVSEDTSWRKRLSSGTFILAGDIGGTNSNFGIIEIINDVPYLRVSLHAKSQHIVDYQLLTQRLMAHIEHRYQLTITRACWGAAGVVVQERTRVTPTNLKVTIDTHELTQNTGLKEVILINDFEAVALGIDYVAPEAIVTINQGMGIP